MSSPRQPSRRDFLDVRSTVQALADSATIGHAPPPSQPDSPDGGILSLRRRAMACEFEVQLAADRRDGSTEHVLEALDLVEALEDQMTVYRADSELLRINRSASLEPVDVEPQLFEVLQLAKRLSIETEGALDITSGPLSDIWGFSRRQGRLPSDGEIAQTLDCVGMSKVLLDEAACTVAFAHSGVTLHLNCIGKGYALDRMAELLDAYAVDNYLLHGGRSSVLARGNCPGSERAGWTIGIRHPLRPDERLAEIDLVNRALGTSGSATQFFHHRGRKYGHILDPRTGWPAAGLHSATAIAATAAEADALSTAFYVMGAAKVAEFCAARPEISALLVAPGERDGDVRVETFGLSDNQWRFSADLKAQMPAELANSRI